MKNQNDVICKIEHNTCQMFYPSVLGFEIRNKIFVTSPNSFWIVRKFKSSSLHWLSLSSNESISTSRMLGKLCPYPPRREVSKSPLRLGLTQNCTYFQKKFMRLKVSIKLANFYACILGIHRSCVPSQRNVRKPYSHR